MSIIDTETPMGAARYVRRERYAFPGGYALALLTTDGGLLCPDCVSSEFRQVSWEHRNKTNGGFRPSGLVCGADTDVEMRCDHCGKVMQQESEELE
ncbi:hypothetical protein XccvBFoX4_gp76 [Xanthomonas phage FoX4]|uniref:Uncharacterized protein n=1 Tax=Xanthomonas phage FoX4 TaxID=2723900 RepID=A0A858WJY9_9CAUD|nr:hypothetical protein KNU97_gp76 [Xanthomonas phage FoX4]QJI53030.1 hypothetical protein XccvBFoX4_gp76 [Xanthomonas phage FoX4]